MTGCGQVKELAEMLGRIVFIGGGLIDRQDSGSSVFGSVTALQANGFGFHN
jgi:hypothetical protein